MLCCVYTHNSWRQLFCIYKLICSIHIISCSRDPCFCQLRYQFEVSSRLGSIKGCVALVVHEGEGEDRSILEQDFESNPVAEEEFGEYVASLHSCNNSTFVLQYEVIQ